MAIVQGGLRVERVRVEGWFASVGWASVLTLGSCGGAPCNPPNLRYRELCLHPCPDAAGFCGPSNDVQGVDAAEDATNLQDAMDAWDATAMSAPDTMDVHSDAVVLAPPRPILPLSTATVTSQHPTFRWQRPHGTLGARVQVCHDRRCTRVVTTFDADGDRTIPPEDLPTGVLFWRAFRRNGSVVGTTPSPVWQVTVGMRSAPVDTNWGTVLDVNGDGFADLAVGAQGAMSGTGQVYVYLGGTAGLATTPATTLTGPEANGAFGKSVASAGDVNGDGFADLAVGSGAPEGEGMVGNGLGSG
jgi:hypothetical protein